MDARADVPESLRRWFVAHCIIDLLFALPLFVAPTFVLKLMEWPSVDPLSTRLVAAALFGIGIQSYLGRNESAATFRGMLNLKMIWSGSAVLGIVISQIQGGPILGWGFGAIFCVFFVVWSRYRYCLG